MTRAQQRFVALLSAVCAVFVAAHAVRYGFTAGHLAGLTVLASQAVLNTIASRFS